ncbi:PH and RecN domain protein [Blumeria hordei DH14]|uniref:PH and RecN domain protein n=1 Tax=Blumeria graminis f. sp. hordei (strain DH14) TaxID=546991 RepID=N1J5D1_BLUG1|nr:PH and RecN domain protein [Blumeria hordei DH14]
MPSIHQNATPSDRPDHTNVQGKMPPKTSNAAPDFEVTLPSQHHGVKSPSTTKSVGRFHEEMDISQRASSFGEILPQKPCSVMPESVGSPIAPRATLKKSATIRRSHSVKRSPSCRSSRAGSVRSVAPQIEEDLGQAYSAFYSPVPTSGNPTEALANRFQAWRSVLKDIISHYKEIQASYDLRAKSLLKVSNIINANIPPPSFLQSGGIHDAVQIAHTHYKVCLSEAVKSKEIENDVISALVGLRSDLQHKIKEIKNLSGDFKNSVEREMEATRKSVHELQESLGSLEIDPSQSIGKRDPYLLRLAVDYQVEKQISEENYLHQAYLNLEASGKALEAIVVGEIQKSYSAYAGILKREADASYATVNELLNGPLTMPRDLEWNHFLSDNENFVDPTVPIRQSQYVQYPAKHHELAQEVRAGLLERKSKYLKSNTVGWYVLSPTHLHEFKSADKRQTPVMSLYLPDQTLGSHSSEDSKSNKFVLRGRQTGTMHRGHSWIFRCESHEIMMSWYEALRNLTGKSHQERQAYVKQHARNVSGGSQNTGSVISSDSVLDDEDEEPFASAGLSVTAHTPVTEESSRPLPGGRFPSSDILATRKGQQGLPGSRSLSSECQGFEDASEAKSSATKDTPAKESCGTLPATSSEGRTDLLTSYHDQLSGEMDPPIHSSFQQQDAVGLESNSTPYTPEIKDDGKPRNIKKLPQIDDKSHAAAFECTREGPRLVTIEDIPSIIPQKSSSGVPMSTDSSLSCKQAHVDGSNPRNIPTTSCIGQDSKSEEIATLEQLDKSKEASDEMHVPGEWQKTISGSIPQN